MSRPFAREMHPKVRPGDETREKPQRTPKKLHKLYTAGYANTTLQALAEWAAKNNATVVDIRHHPTSRMHEWTQPEMLKALRSRYTHEPHLGNPNHGKGPAMLLHPDFAVEPIRQLLTNGPVVLLCGCKNATSCHRRLAGLYMQRHIQGLQVEFR